MKKRILSFVLALLMMVSTVPAPVFAADGGEAAPVSETEAAPTAETTVPTEPEETTVPTEPEETTTPTEPAETTVPTGPEETTAPTEPAETTVPTEPVETTAPTEPEETTAPTEPPVEKPDIPAMFAMFAGRSAAAPQAEADSECECSFNTDPSKGHDATCPLYTCSRCGTGPWHETCPYEAHVGQYAKLIPSEDQYFVNGGTFDDDDLNFVYEEFEENTIFRIAGWYWDSGTTELWYQVEIYSGGVVGESAKYWPEEAWFLQGSTDDGVTSLTFVDCCVHCGKPGCTTEHVQCDKCGEYDCTRLHFWCDRCKKYDCGKSHLFCRACGEVDCTEKHVFCGYCNSYDSCPGHDFSPVTAPVIPANPEMTPGADVSIVDENGSAITGTNGLVIREGTKTSLSAWTDLTGNIDYQWQICYDDENDLWTNIQGQTGKGILVSPAMVNSVIQLTGSAMIRCRITSGATVQYSADIPVEVVQNASASMNRYGLARTARNTALYADAPELNEYTVVINYVFEDNAPVAEPYAATLAAGSSFSTTVPHPNVMGYLPFIGVEQESSTSLPLDIENIQADVTYTVTYKPTNVNYTVIHYQQNIDNDNYTIAATETKQGLTNSQVPEVAENYPGFVSLLYERPAIAADGTTVVEIYYDRNYYLMIFNLGEGGYGVEPIYARYGAPVEIGTPTRPGYTFDGWSPAVPTTVPVDGGIYTAQWTVNDKAKVKVVIWGENPNDEEYSYLTTGELMLTPNNQYTYDGTDQLYLYCDKEAHTHDASCIICGKEEHTQHTEACLGECTHTAHTLDCYSAGNNKLVEATKPGEITNYPTDGIYTYTTSVPFVGQITHYYLYMGGKWYCADGEWYAGGGDTAQISLNCTHTHDDNCYTCETHAHTTSCYGCGKEEHSHDSNCTGTVEGLNSALWKFVKSDTVTVNPDGSSVINVYYDRTSFTMTFKEEGNSGDTLATITDKWGADIKVRFETISKENTFFWSTSKNGGSPWTSFMDVMPAENRTYYADHQSGSTTITATYLAENLERTGYETLYTVSFNGSSTITVTKEEFVEIEGFDFNDSLSSNVGDHYNGSKFYYDRHNYNIEFYNPTTLLKTETGVPYQSQLTSYEWTPDASMAPDKYEPGSVEFEGWYLNPECTGDKFDFTTHTMPSGTNDGDTTLTLYAKWVPVMRTVEFYLDKTAMENGTKLYPDQTTPHGSLLKNPVAEPNNGDYDFVGWFYMDGDEEKAFLFPTMVITKDMKVYGKWSSNVLKEYTVYFKIQGTDTQIADPITGSGVAGHTKTFDAKGGTDLYASYQAGYFPLVKSHSMKLDIENDANNTFTFWYVQKEAVPYTVYYVAETLKAGEIATQYETITRDGKTYYIIADTYINSENRQAVVTEKFEPVSGYMPDAYQKRLVVDGTEGAVNEIIFYYSVDSTHAYYKITHYTQNTDGENWTEYASTEVQGTIGQRYTADPLTIDGFTYDPTVAGTVTSGELTADGLELKLYYVRNKYPYVVRYLEQGTGKQLAEPKTGTGLYSTVVSENAIDIANYTAADPASQTLTIKIEESQTEAKLNIITFYYVEQQATINYVVAIGEGSVTPESENLKVLSGTAQGSTATAAANHKFVGWYSDEECTVLLSTDAKYVPTKADGAVWTNATYYAKFEPNAAKLTITKTGAEAIDENQSFLFTVTSQTGDISIPVVLNRKNNFTATLAELPFGDYTITEDASWSWRYSRADDVTVKVDSQNESVTIDNSRTKIKWLNGAACESNWFTARTN